MGDDVVLHKDEAKAIHDKFVAEKARADALAQEVERLRESWEPREGYPTGQEGDTDDLASRRLRHWAASFPDSHVGLAQQVKACAMSVLAERDALQAQVDAVLGLHLHRVRSLRKPYDYCSHDGEEWPCPTVTALTTDTPRNTDEGKGA